MIEQRTPEWYAERLGRATASRIADIIAKTRTGWCTSRANYAAQLIAERLTGVPGDNYVNAAMQHGIDTEPEARKEYSARSGLEVVECGFVCHPSIDMSGASPDGIIGFDGLCEIKCPSVATHIETLLGGSVPGKYITQIQWQLACCDRQWCDFVSFDNRLPESMWLFVQRVERDDTMIAALEKDVAEFLTEVAAKVSALRERYELAA